jgi:hypothetical protein
VDQTIIDYIRETKSYLRSKQDVKVAFAAI